MVATSFLCIHSMAWHWRDRIRAGHAAGLLSCILAQTSRFSNRRGGGAGQMAPACRFWREFQQKSGGCGGGKAFLSAVFMIEWLRLDEMGMCARRRNAPPRRALPLGGCYGRYDFPRQDIAHHRRYRQLWPHGAQAFLTTDIGEIRIFSRDEKKQDDMRHDLQANYPSITRRSNSISATCATSKACGT